MKYLHVYPPRYVVHGETIFVKQPFPLVRPKRAHRLAQTELVGPFPVRMFV